MKKKFNLTALKVQSFVTTVDVKTQDELKGGAYMSLPNQACMNNLPTFDRRSCLGHCETYPECAPK